MANVKLTDIGKNYGALNVLRGINLEFEDGEFVVLIGPSGCGKSTLLRMIAGLESVTQGDITIDGNVMNDLEARERDIAMVFQSYALYPHMTVAQNIGFPLRIRGLSPDEIKSEVAKVAELTGLSELLDRKPGALSGGQRQRVAMGRAIIRSPKVFLFDEPLSNLDAKLRVQMRLQIRDLHREVGATSVYVTHDQVEAMTLADRVVLLHNGDVQQVGTPLDLYERPANTFVATFIGSPEMNLFEGILASGTSGPTLAVDGGGEIQLHSSVEASLNPGQKLTLGIRAEHLSPGEAGIEVTFRDSEMLGNATHIFANMGNRLVTSVCPGNFRAQSGETLHLTPDTEHFHYFDATTGHRLDV